MKTVFKKTNQGMTYLIVAAILAVLILVVSVAALRTWYNHSLSAVSSSASTQYFTVNQGSGVHEIAQNLKHDGLIRNSSSFETYVTTNDYRNKLQAGTYSLSPSMGTKVIVNKMVQGDVARNLLTILPGKRLDQIKQIFKNSGYSDAEIGNAFNPSNYTDISAIAGLPSGASLEGYLYPDSFQKQSDTPAQMIVRESLLEMQKQLTDDVVNGFKLQGLTVHQGVTLASVVAQESGDPASQPTVAQVFLSRIKQNMPLQSNVTAYYGADLAGATRDVGFDSPYNTYLHSGLPPGPISNITASALRSVAHPSTSTYLYFITGDDGKMYFSYTADQHQAIVQKYCKKGCSQ